MTEILLLNLYVVLGIATVTAIDIIGSIASRKWNYNYSYLSPLSFIVYTAIGFFVGRDTSLISAVAASSLVGVYDGTVGWKLSKIFNANWGELKEQALKTTIYSRLLTMLMISIAFGFAGYLMSKI